MAGERGDGGVVIAERVDRPPHGPHRQRHPRRRQVVGFAERGRRAGGFSTAPNPHQPADHSDPAEARRVVQRPDPSAVTHREHPAFGAGGRQLTRLHGEDQSLLVVDPYLQDVHVSNIENGIGSGAPARTRATHRVRHRRVLRIPVAWSLPILKGPTPSFLDQHAHPTRSRPSPMLRSEEPVKRYVVGRKDIPATSSSRSRIGPRSRQR
jgi:hypothetical protein